MKYSLFIVLFTTVISGCTLGNSDINPENFSGSSEDIQKEIENIIEASTLEEVIDKDEIQHILQELERLAEEAGVE